MATTISVILAFTILTYFHVVMGEIVPKSFTLEHSRAGGAGGRRADHLVPPIFAPFIWVLARSAATVLRWVGLPPPTGVSLVHSEEELKMLVTASRQKGVLEEDEQEMLHKVFEFADKDAADVMVPRPDVVALPIEMPVPDLLTSCCATPTPAIRCSRATWTTCWASCTCATCSVR